MSDRPSSLSISGNSTPLAEQLPFNFDGMGRSNAARTSGPKPVQTASMPSQHLGRREVATSTGSTDVPMLDAREIPDKKLIDGTQAPKRTAEQRASVLPRFVRLRDAPAFFGMDKNRFNREVRPSLTEIRIGIQGRAFDRLEMEAAADEYKHRNGVPVAQSVRRKPSWEMKESQASPSVAESGMSTSSSEELAFAKALEQATCGKRRSTLPSG